MAGLGLNVMCTKTWEKDAMYLILYRSGSSFQ